MSQTMLVSIIIAIYNADKYLHRCINSILSQTFKNIEIILIDDGSTDDSGTICDYYAKIDNKIKVYHQGNKGVASARQKGLELSSGEFIIHCDSDDWIDSCMIEELIQCSLNNNADIVWCDFYTESNKGTKYVSQNINYSNDINSLIESLANAKIMGSLCNFLIKRDLIGNIKFDINQKCCEDLIFILNVLVNNKTAKIAYINKAYYHYFQNNSSILHSLNPEKSLEIYSYTIKKLEEMKAINKKDKNGGGYFYKRIVIGALFKLGRYEEMRHTYPEIHKRIFREMSFTAKFSFFSLALLGYPKTGMLIEKLKQIIKKLTI